MNARIGRPPGSGNRDTRAAVFAYLMHEADMDGLVTVSEQEIADALGLANRTTVNHHIHSLVVDGLLSPDGSTERNVRGAPIRCYRITEDAVA